MGISNFIFSEKYPHKTFHLDQWTKLKNRHSKLNNKLKSFCHRLELGRNQRLAIGLTLVISAFIVAANPKRPEWGLLFLALIPVFTWAVIKTRNLQQFTIKLRLLNDFYLRQLHKIQGNLLDARNSPQHLDPRNSDLNIIGYHSVFSQLDETFSIEAAQSLAEQLNSGLSSIAAIQHCHEKIQQLNNFSPITRRFLIEGRRAAEPIRLSDLENLFNTPITSASYKWFALGHFIFFPAYIFMFLLIGYGRVQAPLALPIVVYAVFALVSLKSVLAAFRQGEILERSLSSLVPVFGYIERRKDVFKKELPSLGEKNFSSSLKTLKTYVSFLSIQSHALAYLIINALCPWTFVFSGLTETWRKKNKDLFLSLLKEMLAAEVSASLSVFYRYQSRTLPEVTDSFQLKTNDIYHPMIPRSQVVANDTELSKEFSIMLLTGSNMSGKSTFMRTVAVNQTLALAGAPVFASHMQTAFAPVISCMQIKDSLEMGYSYFYAEVKRVKEIIDQVKSGHKTFFFIDESPLPH